MSGYFSYYPTAIYSSKAVTDLIVRTKIKDTWLSNPKLYYQYRYKDGDRAEHLAQKYYGDERLHWIILFTNNIFDVNWELPMTYEVFNRYIDDKYKDLGALESKTGLQYAQTTPDPIYKFQKKITITNSEGSTTNYYTIDEKTYYNLTETPQIYSTGLTRVKYISTVAGDNTIIISDTVGINSGDIITGNSNIPTGSRIGSRVSNNEYTINSIATGTEQLAKSFITSVYNGATIYEESRRSPQVTIYERELDVNETKRDIRILNKTYVQQAVTEFVKLLKQY
jgi:hypothetical protein